MKAFLILLMVFGGGLALFVIGAPLLSGANDRAYTQVAAYHYRELRMKAERGDLPQAASALKEVLEFWPPKISHESSAARVVAGYRRLNVQQILRRMQDLSGEDLGAEPEAWLKKYYKAEETQPNPLGGADRRQPSGSDTNSPSGAAASRGSP